MLIEFHDVNFNKIIFSKMKIRFRQNKDWIEEKIKLEKREALELKRIREKLPKWIPDLGKIMQKQNTLLINLNGLCGHYKYIHMFKQLEDLYSI